MYVLIIKSFFFKVHILIDVITNQCYLDNATSRVTMNNNK